VLDVELVAPLDEPRLNRVVDGRVEVDSELPEGASVTVLAREGDPETQRILRDAIARCERGEAETRP
jgi:hypothetical protein